MAMVIGDIKWMASHILIEADIIRSYLVEGINQVKITEVGDLDLDLTDPDSIYFNWIEIDCWHTFKVTDNELFCKASTSGFIPVRISGFTEQNIIIYDISDSFNPTEIVDFSIKDDNGSYSALFDRDVNVNSSFIYYPNPRFVNTSSYN